MSLAHKVVDRIRLRQLAEEHADHQDVMFDHVSRLPSAMVTQLAGECPDAMAQVAMAMGGHLLEGDWGRRRFEDLDRPIGFILLVARTLAAKRKFGLLEDVAITLFKADALWTRYSTRRQIREWLTTLTGPAGQAAARSMREAGSEAVAWYREEGWGPARLHRNLAIILGA